MGSPGALRVISSTLCTLACLMITVTALADKPFNKQLRIVVPVAAGSSLDARARIIAHALGEQLKVQPIVENKPGAGGTIGSAFVAKAPADGGSSGNGGLPHLAMEVFNRAAGIRLVHIAYKGDSQALADIIAGRVSVMVSGIPAALPQIRSGSLRALGVTTGHRVRALADVPTVAEAGLPGYDTYA